MYNEEIQDEIHFVSKYFDLNSKFDNILFFNLNYLFEVLNQQQIEQSGSFQKLFIMIASVSYRWRINNLR